MTTIAHDPLPTAPATTPDRAVQNSALRLSQMDCDTIFQAGLALHNANLPIWDQGTFPRRPPANELIHRLKGLDAGQQKEIYSFAMMAEHGDGPHAREARPHRLMLGLMAHLALVAELRGLSLTGVVPRMTWAESAPRAERFVRLLLSAAGCDLTAQSSMKNVRLAQLVEVAEPVFKKRTGQGGRSELRALARKIVATYDAERSALVQRIPLAKRRHAPLPLSPLRSPRTPERTLAGAAMARAGLSRRLSSGLLSEFGASDASELGSQRSAGESSPHAERRSLSRTPSEESWVAPYYHDLAEQLRARYAQSRRPSQLSLSSSWAGLSDERSVASEGLDTWQDVERPEP